MEYGKVKMFADLDAWRYSYKLGLDVYEITKLFPKEESFGLTSQMRRAIISVSSNIAEGFSRHTVADKSRFYAMAHGSLTELQSQLYIARGVKYLSDSTFQELNDKSIKVHKLLTGLIKSTKKRSSI